MAKVEVFAREFKSVTLGSEDGGDGRRFATGNPRALASLALGLPPLLPDEMEVFGKASEGA